MSPTAGMGGFRLLVARRKELQPFPAETTQGPKPHLCFATYLCSRVEHPARLPPPMYVNEMHTENV